MTRTRVRRMRWFDKIEDAHALARHLLLVEYERYLGLEVWTTFLRPDDREAYTESNSYWDGYLDRRVRVRITRTETERAIRGDDYVFDAFWNCAFVNPADRDYVGHVVANLDVPDTAMIDAIDNEAEGWLKTDGATADIEERTEVRAKTRYRVTIRGIELADDRQLAYRPSREAIYSLRRAFPDPKQREAILTRDLEFRVPYFERAIAAYPLHEQTEQVPYNPLTGFDGDSPYDEEWD